MKRITIIGGGASGVLLAINLLKNAGSSSEPLKICLVERKDRLARGVAYSTETDYHLLNVPANKIGAFPDDVEHFFKWLAARNHHYFSNDFVPRRLYGEYLRDLFYQSIAVKPKNVSLSVVDGEAVDVSINGEEAQVALSSGAHLAADKIVLAFGNFPPPHPRSESRSFIEAEKYFQNSWDAETYRRIEPQDDVFIIGTGLSGVDAALSLHHNRHAGKIYLFSTRGLLPAVHELGFVYPSFYDEISSMTRITDLLKAVRRHIRSADKQNSNWRAVIDSLRPHTQSIWRNLPEAEKRYFMQHLSRYWGVARHRMPPECADVLNKLRAENQLEILKGRLKNIESTNVKNDAGKLDVTFSNQGEEITLTVGAVINCIGSESDFSRLDVPLIKNLIAKGLIKSDSLKLGIDAAPEDGRVINRDGEVSDRIYALGTALKGVLWESTAMPEIRTQASRLALTLLE